MNQGLLSITTYLDLDLWPWNKLGLNTCLMLIRSCVLESTWMDIDMGSSELLYLLVILLWWAIKEWTVRTRNLEHVGEDGVHVDPVLAIEHNLWYCTKALKHTHSLHIPNLVWKQVSMSKKKFKVFKKFTIRNIQDINTTTKSGIFSHFHFLNYFPCGMFPHYQCG